MTEEDSSRMASFLKDNPRMIGVLFTLVVLLTQAGSVLAEGPGCGACSGP